METKQPRSSVIARLMGFDEISAPPQPVLRHNRVLSEDYLQKSDSICLLQKQSYRKRRLSKVNSKTGQRNANSIEVQGREKLHRSSTNSVQQGDTNSRIEMADASRYPSKIVILRPILGKSESDMMLNFISARKTSKQLLEKWKMTKSAKQFAATRQSKATVDDYGTLDRLRGSEKGNYCEDISKNIKISSCTHSCKATKETKAPHDMPRKCCKKNQGFEISAESLKMFPEYTEGKHFEPTPCTLDAEDDNLLIEPESPVSSRCPNIDPELHMSPGEYYSPSPSSVLDPLFNEGSISSSDSYEDIGADPNGLQKQLQLLESQSGETPSGEHGMVVSSDVDSGDESVDCYNRNRFFLQLFKPEESRDSSYIDDIFDEACFFDNNMKLGSKAWHFLQCPLNPSVFEMLEKKYDNQSSWDKSERRLLFDRINLELKGILDPYVDPFADMKPLRKSFKLSQSRVVIENELRRLLVSHENGVNRTLSEKAVGTETKWFDLRDDIDFIVCEIEQFLFEELSAELFYD